MKIDFEFETKFGVYRDALWLYEDRVYSPKEIEDMKMQRLNNWLAIVDPPPENSPEEGV